MDMNKTLLERFKEEYESASDFRVVDSNVDINGNLTVTVRDKDSEMWLHVKENEKGEIIWW